MENYTLDLDFKKYVFFVDKRNPKDFYVMSIAEHEKYYKIINNYDRNNENVPDEFSIFAIQLGKISENTFGLINENKIEFPINNIRWEFIRTIKLF